MKKTVLLFTLVALIFSCRTTQTVSWPTGTSGSTLELPENTQKIALLNRVIVAYAPGAMEDKRLYPNNMNAMNGLLTGFYNEVYNRRYLTFTGTLHKYQRKADGQFADTLSMSEIQSIRQNADIVVALEMLQQYYEDQYTIEIRKEKITANTFKEVDYAVGKRSMKLLAGWRVYNAKTGEVIDEYLTEEDYFYEAESPERQRSTELLEMNMNKELKNMGLRLGHEYATRVSPTKHFTYRNIYVTGSDDLEAAAAKVRDNHWDDANDIWTKALDKESNNKRKAMLYHNLAMYEERSGNMTQAKEYARLAANHHKIGLQTQRVVGF